MSEMLTMKVVHDDYLAEIVAGDGVYILRWNDHVVNEWSQPFDTLASAVIGLGVLVQAIEDGVGADFDAMVPRIQESFKLPS